MVDSRLFNHWVLKGREENGIRIYTPKKRGLDNSQQLENKDSFEIKENGEFIKYETSGSGIPVRYFGRYEIKGNELYTQFKNHYLDSILIIEELEDKVLKIR
ncbi:MAG: hypothetical protein WBN72_08405 [Nitrososphaeraceae archaeon]